MKKGERTREHILTTAAGVFARQGKNGASVRAICEAAQVNVAAISMYFGSKDGLYQEILDRGFAKLVALRVASLKACMENEDHDLNDLVAAFVDPLLLMHRDRETFSRDFLAILSRTLFELDFAYQQSSTSAANDVVERFVTAIHALLPDLSRREVERRMGFAVGAISQALADPNRIVSSAGQADSLKAFIAGGLAARTPGL